MELPIELKKYFWEIDFDKLDYKEKPEYVALRILEYGDIKAVQWLLQNIDKKVIKQVLKKRRGLSLKSWNFWSLFFNFSKSAIKQWLKKFYQNKQKPVWNY